MSDIEYDAADSDDTSSERSEEENLHQYVPALRHNTIVDSHCVQHDASRSSRRRRVRRRSMTKYEYIRLRSMRVAQLAHGALPLVSAIPEPTRSSERPPLSIYERVFEEEMRKRRLPYIIRRAYADGHTEHIRASELDCTRWVQQLA